MKKSVTLKDIARATGVHVSTVSRALDPSARKNLTAEVIQKVQVTAAELGYRPNRLASALRTRRTMTIGMVLPDITNTLFPPIVRGIESVLEPLGYASIIVNTDGLAEREDKLLDVLLERGVDGIIHAAVERKSPHIVEIVHRGIPAVTVNRQIEDAQIPYIVNDDALGIRLALEALAEAGHRRIAHIAGPQRISTGVLRRETFEAVARELGLEVDRSWIEMSQRYDEDEGRRCAGRLLSGASRPTAILCANDRLALGALEAIQAAGLSCPADISLTGFNDIPFLGLIPPGLTTVRVQRFEVGRISAEYLLRMIRQPETVVPSRTILPVDLVERGSIGPPPG